MIFFRVFKLIVRHEVQLLLIRISSISEECQYLVVDSVENGIQEIATGDPLGGSLSSPHTEDLCL